MNSMSLLLYFACAATGILGLIAIKAHNDSLNEIQSGIHDSKSGIDGNKSGIHDSKSGIDDNKSGINDNKSGIHDNSRAHDVELSKFKVSKYIPSKTAKKCNLEEKVLRDVRSYLPIVRNITDFVINGDFKGETYRRLANFVDLFGSRLTGSESLDLSIDWMLDWFTKEGLENVHTENATVPHWVRNNESCWMLLPRPYHLNILGLGGSVGTGPVGIKAEVIVVRSFDDLKAKEGQVKGKIVVYNMKFTEYEETVIYRSLGASEAGKRGAVAALVRSIAPFSIDSPHTGWQSYEDGAKKIPVACITVEDAAMLDRLQERGITAILHLKMGATTYPDVVSRNSIAEVKGYSLQNEVVMVSGHLDSWDVGQGAMDDGGGAFISWNSLVVMKRLGLRPRRTIRTVLWTGEEQGLWGSQAYYEDHEAEKDNFQLLLESDGGTFAPRGISFSGSPQATCIMKEIVALLRHEHMSKVVSPMNGGPDIEVWEKAGVPAGSLLNDNGKYFWFHHSNGDTMTVEDSHVLDKCTALWTAVAFVAADMTTKIPQGRIGQVDP